jgi:hypothetical protein
MDEHHLLFTVQDSIATITMGEGVGLALEGFAATLGATTHDGRKGPAAFREKRAPFHWAVVRHFSSFLALDKPHGFRI